MNETKMIWKNGDLVPWGQAQTHVLTHGLHYGSSVFEGIRCYKTEVGTAVFKLKEHMSRFLYSAEKLKMPISYSEEALCAAVINTVRTNQLEEGYIRPLAYYGYGKMKVVPEANFDVDIIVACWPWKNYLPVDRVDVATSDYIRIHPQSTVADAKISGHYVNSILAGLALRGTHYHEVLLLDSNGMVTEGGAENIFIVKNGKIITTPPGTILVGITRNTVMQIANELGIPVEERQFKPEEVYEADEAFFSGTAVEITPLRSLDNNVISQGKIGSITEKIKTRYAQIVRGEIASYHSSLTWVIP